jgi:HlyD family secretion protein
MITTRRATIPMTLCAAALALLAAACHEKPTVETAVVVRKSLVVPILADGTLEPPPGGEVRAPEGGIVGAIFVHEGQRVTKGTAILRLDNADADQRVLSGKQESAQLAAELQSNAVETEVAMREAEHLKSVAEADARLVKSGAITAQQLATDELAYRQADQKARQAAAHRSEIATRKRLVDQSTGDLERRAALRILRAPTDGIVYNLPRGPGESIAPGQLVATVADPNHLRVRARVDAPDLPRVRAGQRMIVTFDGLPNQKWEGSVMLVPPGLRDVGGREVGEVIGEIHGDASALPANASVNVEIVVGEKESALVIPRGALLKEGSTRVVYRYIDGKAVRTPVSVGLIGPTEVEVVSGVREGERVILPGPTPLRDGQPVKLASSP